MQRKILYILFCFLAFRAGAQTLQPNVISTSGNYYTGAGVTWSWTLGQTVIPTYTDASNIVSQGFQQPEVQTVPGTFVSPQCAGNNFSLPFNAYGIIGSNNVFTAQISDTFGSFASPTNVGTNTGNKSGNISVTIPGSLPAGTYHIRVISSLPDFNLNDPGVTIVISVPGTASVSITSSPGTTFCAGTNATFTAKPTNGGTTPIYQWQVNGTNAGTNSNIFTTSTLNTGDIVKCIMTSNAACVSGSPANNTVTVTVTPNVAASVSVAANPGTNVCTGTPVTFTASQLGGGTSPSYQWTLNGTNVGINSATYTNSTPSNKDVVICIMTSNATCVTGSPASSTADTIKVAASFPAGVIINSAPGDTVCAGTPITFTASPINGGTTPIYQWQLNGTNVGTNATIYSNNSPNNGDIVKCIITSNANCVTGSPASNSVTIAVNQPVPVTVSISGNPSGTICAGTPVSFTATGTNTGTTPAYQWQVNGINEGTNSNTFSSSSLDSGDVVKCTLTSNATCITGSPASSSVTMIVTTPAKVSVTVSANSGSTVCPGTPVDFTATPASGGTNPSYQWKLNGNNVGSNSSDYTDASPGNGDIITCIITSNASCITGSPATSNPDTVVISNSVKAVINVSASSTSFCSGTLVNFNATTQGGGTNPTFQWILNNNNVGTNSSTYSNSNLNNGDSVKCIMTSNSSCVTGSPVTSTAVKLSVTPTVAASVNVTANPGTSICSGTPVTFNAQTQGGGTSPSFQWELNGTNVGTNASSYQNNNLKTGDVVKCILTSNATCVTGSPDTSLVTITVVQGSVAGAVSTPKPDVCANTVVHLALKGNSGSGIQWESSHDSITGYTVIAGTTGTAYITAPLTTTTYYRVIVGTGFCADTTDVYKITIEPAPVAAFTYSINGKVISFNGSSSMGALTYSWDFGDGSPTSSEENPTHTYDSVTTYPVCLTVRNSNCNFTDCQTITTYPTGINNVNFSNGWSVYPDPFSAQLFISTGTSLEKAESIEMYDLLGRKVLSMENVIGNPIKLDVDNIKEGVYFLRVRTEAGEFVKSVIKQ